MTHQNKLPVFREHIIEEGFHKGEITELFIRSDLKNTFKVSFKIKVYNNKGSEVYLLSTNSFKVAKNTYTHLLEQYVGMDVNFKVENSVRNYAPVSKVFIVDNIIPNNKVVLLRTKDKN